MGCDKMRYKGFYIEIIPCSDIERSDKDCVIQHCQGFKFTIFADESKSEKIDEFTAAVGYELLENRIEEAEQFAKDVVGCDTKEAFGMELSQ